MNEFGGEVEHRLLAGPGGSDGVVWGRELARLDSDGDGFTNGEELQDPSGSWRPGDRPPGLQSLVTNPGDRRDAPEAGGSNPASGVLRGTCSIRNTGGRAGMVVEVENAAGQTLQNLTPSSLSAESSGTASIFFQTSPRPLRSLLPRKSASFRWQGLLFGDGYLELWLEVTARFENGDATTTGPVRCPRLTVGNPGGSPPPEVEPTSAAAEPTPTRGTSIRPTRTMRPTRTPIALRPTRTPVASRPTRTPLEISPTRTPIPTSTRRPTRTPRAGATAPGSPGGSNPDVDSSRFTGSCSISAGAPTSRVVLAVRNRTGATLTNVVPSVASTAGTGTAAVDDLRGPGPRSARRLTNGQRADFLWRAQLHGNGQVSMQLEATGTLPDGGRVSTGQVECTLAIGSSGGDLPDLVLDERDLRESLLIETADFDRQECAVADRCVGAPGRRRLLRFDTTAVNVGEGDFFIGDPSQSPLTTYSQCRSWWVFEEYSEFRLLDLEGNLVATGHKEAFCLTDHDRRAGAGGPTPQFTDCRFQGISAGWTDVYHRELDCQWIDITGVPEDLYVLEVHLNPAGVVEEANYSNNVGRTEVFIPHETGR
jgi:hypothetical protein